MCGIVGYIGQRDVAPLLLEGLQRLEYRGYDSAGIVVNSPKASGSSSQGPGPRAGEPRPQALRRHHRHRPHPLGHPRAPSDVNSHPHLDEAGTRSPSSTTASSTTPPRCAPSWSRRGRHPRLRDRHRGARHLIARCDADTLEEKVREALGDGRHLRHRRHARRLRRPHRRRPQRQPAGGRRRRQGDVRRLRRRRDRPTPARSSPSTTARWPPSRPTTSAPIRHSDLVATATTATVEWEAASYDMGGHDTYMHKEILEQPDAVNRVLRGRLDDRFGTVHLGGLDLDARELARVRRVKILGLRLGLLRRPDRRRADRGAGPHPRRRRAGQRVPLPRPGHRPRHPLHRGQPVRRDHRHAAAVQELTRKGARVLGVVNVVGSAIARECRRRRCTCTPGRRSARREHQGADQHGPRLRAARPAAGPGPRPVGRRRQADGRGPARGCPRRSRRSSPARTTWSRSRRSTPRRAVMIFIGRVRGYPVAREAAQKFKEISYLHAEAYQASELKHGPLALIDPEVPTVALVPRRRADRAQRRCAARDRGAQGPARGDHPRGRRPRRGQRPPHRRTRATSRSSTRSCSTSRSSCWPTTRRSTWATTSTSRATSPSRSRSSDWRPAAGEVRVAATRTRRSGASPWKWTGRPLPHGVGKGAPWRTIPPGFRPVRGSLESADGFCCRLHHVRWFRAAGRPW